MTLQQVKDFTVGVLKGWITNKTTLDKLAEKDGKLTFNSESVGSKVESSDKNGYIVIDGVAYKVYDETAITKLATHSNRSVLDKFAVNTEGVLIFDGSAIKGEGTKIESSERNGYIILDGKEFRVYNEDDLKKLATHANRVVLDKLAESDDGKLLFDGKYIVDDSGNSGGDTGGGSVVEPSTTNGYLYIDGERVCVYNDSTVRSMASHNNRSVLDKLSISADNELLYNNKKIGLNSYKQTETVEMNVDESTLIFTIKDYIQNQYTLNNTEFLIHNLASKKSAEITIYEKNILLDTITIEAGKSQRYNLGISDDLVIYGKGIIHARISMIFTANDNNVVEIN